VWLPATGSNHHLIISHLTTRRLLARARSSASRAGIIRSDRTCEGGMSGRPPPARYSAPSCRRSSGGYRLYVSLEQRSDEKPCHGSGFRCLFGSTALYMHPALDTNANDVAHAAAFPPAVSRHGGRHDIRSPLLSVQSDGLISTRAFDYGCARGRHRRLQSSDALIRNWALESDCKRPRRMRFSARIRSDALKYIRGFGCDVIGEVRFALRRSDDSGSKGLSTPDGLRIRPKEMRILPLRSAVQMGSDVSLGSSVTPDRSAIAVDPNWTHSK
jgi:hypothetical protein